MYYVVGADGQAYPADLNALQQWAQTGHLRPDAIVMETATGKTFRADQMPALAPVFASHREAAALAQPPRPKSPLKVLAAVVGGGWILVSILMAVTERQTFLDRHLSPRATARRETRLHNKPLPKITNKKEMPMPVAVYLLAMYEKGTHLIGALEKWQSVAAEFGNISPTPTPKAGAEPTEPWRDRVIAASDAIIAASEPLANIEPVPPDCKYVDAKIKAFARVCRDVAADYKEGLNLNPRKLREANAKVEEGDALIEDLQDEVGALLDRYKSDADVDKAAQRGLKHKAK